MKKITTLLLLFIGFQSLAQDSSSVLFIGNSYIYYNDLPTIFSNLTISLGDEATIDSKTNGGYTFQNHLNDPITHSKIQSKPWDYVILQGQSQEPSFPYDQVNTNTLTPATQLADSVYENNYCSQALYFMTWGRQNGDPQWDSINTFDKMNGRLRDAYLRISDSAQGSVAPVGVAWKYIRDNNPTINLYNGDGSHPSLEGTYLAACTFYASVFRKPSLGAVYTAGLDVVTAGILQNAADLAVLDSLEIWHLRPNDEVSIANFHFIENGNSVQLLNDSWRSTNYEWNFGDGNTSQIENPNHIYASPGTYSVELIASSICGSDTIAFDVVIEEVGINEISINDFVKRTIDHSNYAIKCPSDLSLYNLVLVDATGNTIKGNQIFYNQSENTINVNLVGLTDGLYFLNLQSNEGNFVFELLKVE